MDVTIVEVSPRDGLQNESRILPTETKVELIRRLIDGGCRRIEAVSFAHPRLVPAMADAESVMASAPSIPGVSYAGLVLNRRGLDRSLDCGINEVNVVVCVSDPFSKRNQNMSTQQAMAVAQEIIDAARQQGLGTTLTLATAFGCPFHGDIHPEDVIPLAVAGADAGVNEVALADTVGVASPREVRTLIADLRSALGAGPQLRCHFHNTRNTGFANAYAAVLEGVTVLDSSTGGIGGCPFAPRATGNIATEDLAYLLQRSGWRAGLDLESLIATSRFLADNLGYQLPALLPRAESTTLAGRSRT